MTEGFDMEPFSWELVGSSSRVANLFMAETDGKISQSVSFNWNKETGETKKKKDDNLTTDNTG